MRSRIFVQTRRYVLVAVVLLAISWCGYWFGTLSVQPERRNDMEYRYQMQNKLQDDNARDDLFELPEVQPDHNKQASSNNGHIANKENVMMAQKHDAPEWENVENIIEVNREDLQKSNQIVKGPAQVYKQSARHNSHYTLIHSGSASLIHGDVHKDIPSFSDHIDPRTYMFTTDHLPQDPRHRPSIANGQLGTVVHSREIFMNGVYSGKLNKTHRAVIPSTVSMNITGTEPATKFTRTYVLNVAQGIYSETSVSKTYTLAHRIYAHRNMTQLLVVEVDLIRSEVTDDLTFNVDLNKFGPSFDLTFHQYDSGIPEVSYKFGRGNSAEIPGTEPCVVHVYYDHIPQMLRPTRGTARTKWVFLSSFATTKDEARDAYLKGAALVQTNDALYSQHVHSWFSLWQAGRIDILGNRKLAKAVYGSWFYILSSLPLKQNMNNTFIGLSPSGLPLGDIAKDYQGHVFWDQEVWMYPPILLHHFNLAELILTTRNRTLNQAHMNALENHHRGLQYPWESALSGIEVCRGRKYSLREVHVTADISIAILQHLYATRNRSKLADSRYVDLLVGIAEYWVSRMTLNEKTNLYEVYDVMPPDEHVDHVNNSAYTNAAVQLSLHAADYALSMLDNNEQHKYQHYAQHMYIPYDGGKKYHPEFDGFSYVGKGLLPTGKFVKQADVILLGYPLQREMPEVVRENDLIIYEQLTDPGGPAMSWSMFAIGWLEVNKPEKAETYFMKNFDNIRNEFQVWTEYSSGNGASNFITGAGGFLQALTSGYTGIRIKYDRLDINPRLPPGGTTALHLIGLDYLGSSIDIFLREDGELVFTLISGSQDLIVYVYSSEDIYDLKIQQSINVKAEKMCIRLKQDGVPDR